MTSEPGRAATAAMGRCIELALPRPIFYRFLPMNTMQDDDLANVMRALGHGERPAVAVGEHRLGQARGGRGVDVDHARVDAPQCVVGQEAGGGAGAQALDVVLRDIGVDLPALRVDQDAQCLAGIEPASRLPLRIDIAPDPGERRLELHAAEFLAGGLDLGELLSKTPGGGARLLEPLGLGMQAGELGNECRGARLVAGLHEILRVGDLRG